MTSLLPLVVALPLWAPALDDHPSPPIEAATWLNHIGQTPSLETLKGRPVLIERWATW